LFGNPGCPVCEINGFLIDLQFFKHKSHCRFSF
jgi:hypothetical protein